MSVLDSLGGAQQVASGLLGIFRKNFEKDGHLLPVAFLWITCDPFSQTVLAEPAMVVVALDLTDKDEAFGTLRKMATAGKAVCVIHATEAWKKNLTLDVSPQDIQKMKDEGLEHEPGRTEAIFVMMEHQASRYCQTWEAEILRTGTSVVLQPFTTSGPLLIGLHEGRATNILSVDLKNLS